MLSWSDPNWSTERILITVMAYPEPSANYTETTCVAGITSDGRPVRLFPVRSRHSYDGKPLSKFDIVEAKIQKATSDARPESHRIDNDSIKIVGHVKTGKGEWQDRDNWIANWRLGSSIEELIASVKNKTLGSRSTPSLTLVTPRSIERLVIRKRNIGTWTADEQAKLARRGLFEETDRPMLEKIPFDFLYRFTCENPQCIGHEYRVLDWEMSESYRKWLRRYGVEGWESKFRLRYEEEFLTKKNLQFFIGSMHNHPWVYSIIGLYYPPMPVATDELQQGRLLD